MEGNGNTLKDLDRLVLVNAIMLFKTFLDGQDDDKILKEQLDRIEHKLDLLLGDRDEY